MTKLRFGVKKPFGSNIPSEPYKPKPKPDASDILFETINHLPKTGHANNSFSRRSIY